MMVWNRVMLGPYPPQEAERTQSELQAQSIDSLLLKAVP
ncbi:SPOR domain-containing protein [Candidatus Coxiella mudrowiae]